MSTKRLERVGLARETVKFNHYFNLRSTYRTWNYFLIFLFFRDDAVIHSAHLIF